MNDRAVTTPLIEYPPGTSNLEKALTEALRASERARILYKRALRQIAGTEAPSSTWSVLAVHEEMVATARAALEAVDE